MPYGNVTYKEALQSVGKGWWFLIRIAYRYKPEQARIAQIKEKFGTLRIYVDNGNMGYNDIIRVLESISSRTCEWCGNKGEADTYSYWIKTLCEDCKIKRRGDSDS